MVMLVGALLGNFGYLQLSFKEPLEVALRQYKDNPPQQYPAQAYKTLWTDLQTELKCCGINNVHDWSNGTSFGFMDGTNKPLGCCQLGRDGAFNDTDQQEACRQSSEGPDSLQYYFQGCYTATENQVRENQHFILLVVSSVISLMFLNLLFSFFFVLSMWTK